MSGNRRTYRSDPIQEALCEIRFRRPTAGWALLPGQLFDRLKDSYPAEPTQDGDISNFTSAISPAGAVPFQVRIGQPMQGRIRLSTLDQTEQVMFSGSAITISCLKPYKGWERFRGRIFEVMSCLDDIFEDGFDVERVGVRYINKVNVLISEIDKYFGVRPVRFEGFPLELSNFVCRSELPFTDDEKSLVIATFASVIGESALILDLDVISQNLEEVNSIASCMELIDRLRQLEREAFEASITDDTRDGPFGGFDVIRG